MEKRLSGVTRSILIGIVAIGLMCMSTATANAQWPIQHLGMSTINTGKIVGVTTHPEESQYICIAHVDESPQATPLTLLGDAAVIPIRGRNGHPASYYSKTSLRFYLASLRMCDLLLRGLQLDRVKIGIGYAHPNSDPKIPVTHLGLAMDNVDYENKLDLNTICTDSVCKLSGPIKAFAVGTEHAPHSPAHGDYECMAGMEVNGKIVDIEVPGYPFIDSYPHLGRHGACDALATAFSSGRAASVSGEIVDPHILSIDNDLNVSLGQIPITTSDLNAEHVAPLSIVPSVSHQNRNVPREIPRTMSPSVRGLR